MKIFLIYFFLFTFWIEHAVGIELTNISGLSWFNLSTYLFLLVGVFSIALKRRLFEWNPINTYIILFIFMVILSIPYKILLDEMPNISLKREIIIFVRWLQPLVLFFILFSIIDDKKTCKRALLGLIILLFVVSLSTPLTSLNIISIGRHYFAGGSRASGFADVNEFAAFLVLFIPLILTFMLFHKSYAFRALSAIVLLVSFIALFTTGSRGGFLSLFLGVSVYFTILYRQNAIRMSTLLQIMVAVLIISVLSFVLAPSKIKATILDRLNPAKSESIEGYSSNRLNIWRRSIKLFVERPIFGHGQRTISDLMEIKLWEKKRVAHNQYLNHLVEFGIIGCAIFILMFVKVFQVMWKYQKTAPDLWVKMLFISYVAGLIGYTISMLFVNLGVPRYIFWFYTAVLIRYGQLEEYSSKNPTPIVPNRAESSM